MYSCSSLIGLVSSKRRWQRPPNSWAIPKLSAIALGWPRWRYPFGSGGKRVTTSETLPSRTSAATISRMRSRRSGEAGVLALTLLLVISMSSLFRLTMRAKAYSRRFGSEEAEGMAVRIQHHPDMLLRLRRPGGMTGWTWRGYRAPPD